MHDGNSKLCSSYIVLPVELKVGLAPRGSIHAKLGSKTRIRLPTRARMEHKAVEGKQPKTQGRTAMASKTWDQTQW